MVPEEVVLGLPCTDELGTLRYRYTAKGGVCPDFSEVFLLDGTHWKKLEEFDGMCEPDLCVHQFEERDGCVQQVTHPGIYALQFRERDGDVHQVMFEITISGSVRTKGVTFSDDTEGWMLEKRMPWGAKGDWGHRRCLVGVEENTVHEDGPESNCSATA